MFSKRCKTVVDIVILPFVFSSELCPPAKMLEISEQSKINHFSFIPFRTRVCTWYFFYGKLRVNFTCCHTETEGADGTCYLIQPRSHWHLISANQLQLWHSISANQLQLWHLISANQLQLWHLISVNQLWPHARHLVVRSPKYLWSNPLCDLTREWPPDLPHPRRMPYHYATEGALTMRGGGGGGGTKPNQTKPNQPNTHTNNTPSPTMSQHTFLMRGQPEQNFAQH